MCDVGCCLCFESLCGWIVYYKLNQNRIVLKNCFLSYCFTQGETRDKKKTIFGNKQEIIMELAAARSGGKRWLTYCNSGLVPDSPLRVPFYSIILSYTSVIISRSPSRLENLSFGCCIYTKNCRKKLELSLKEIRCWRLKRDIMWTA